MSRQATRRGPSRGRIGSDVTGSGKVAFAAGEVRRKSGGTPADPPGGSTRSSSDSSAGPDGGGVFLRRFSGFGLSGVPARPVAVKRSVDHPVGSLFQPVRGLRPHSAAIEHGPFWCREPHAKESVVHAPRIDSGGPEHSGTSAVADSAFGFRRGGLCSRGAGAEFFPRPAIRCSPRSSEIARGRVSRAYAG
jgi:hypothetical protein